MHHCASDHIDDRKGMRDMVLGLLQDLQVLDLSWNKLTDNDMRTVKATLPTSCRVLDVDRKG